MNNYISCVLEERITNSCQFTIYPGLQMKMHPCCLFVYFQICVKIYFLYMLEINVDSHKISRCTCNTYQIYSNHLFTVPIWYAFNYILVTLSLMSILWLQLEDGEYRPLDPDNIRLPPPAPPSERLLAAVEAFYAPPCHDRPRDR
jgi:hypothetical protein